VPRFRLRYQGTDLELPAGEFVIGRSASCNLALDDALVSRRHATIEAKSTGLYVQDLGSRNGVVVNGTRIDGPKKLSHLDRVTIGSHEIVVVEIEEEKPVRCDRCGNHQVALQGRCRRCGAPVTREGSATLVGLNIADMNKTADFSDEPTGTSILLAGLAEKALALGRIEEGERVLQPILMDMAARAQAGEMPMRSKLGEGTSYALRLADATKKTAWIDWIFEVHTATGQVLSTLEIDKVHEVVRRVKYMNVALIRRYVDKLRARELSPSERFLVQRIEAIVRVVSA
jgi:hypothetical protein